MPEPFERNIPYKHSIGTMEMFTVTEAGKGRDFMLKITTPDKRAPTVNVYLEGYLLDVMIDTLLDLKEACERRECHGKPDAGHPNA